MKIKLLNDGGFTGLNEVVFPLEVPAEEVEMVGTRALVNADFMHSVGAVFNKTDIGDDDFYMFLADEYEVVE